MDTNEQSVALDLYVGGEIAERLYMGPGDEFGAEINATDIRIAIPEQ